MPGRRGGRDGWTAERLLAQALVGQGKAGPAEDLLAGQFARARTDAERAEIASVRALNLYWGLNQPEQASAVLDGAAAQITESARRAGLRPCAAGSCCTAVAAPAWPFSARSWLTPTCRTE